MVRVEKKKNEINWNLLLRIPVYLLVYSLVTSLFSGLLLAWYYIPSPGKAAISIDYIQREVFAGSVVFYLHKMSGILSVFFALLSTFAVFTKRKKGIVLSILQSGIVLIIILIFMQISGYFLNGKEASMFALRSVLRVTVDKLPGSTGLPSLFNNAIPVAFVRVYLFHILIIPLVGVWCFIKFLRRYDNLYPGLLRFTIQKASFYAVFFTALIISAIYVKPFLELPFTYKEDVIENVPIIIRIFVSVMHTISGTMAVLFVVVFLLLLWLMKYFFGIRRK